MKIIVGAFVWSVGVEVSLLAPVLLGNHVQFFPFDIIFGVLAR